MTEIEKLAVIDHFERELSQYTYNSETINNKGLRTIYSKKAKMLSLLLYMAKKQIPKKPIDEFSTHAICDNDGNYLEQLDTATFKCPICNRILASGEISITDCVEIHYCDNCGQALDWSETNDK